MRVEFLESVCERAISDGPGSLALVGSGRAVSAIVDVERSERASVLAELWETFSIEVAPILSMEKSRNGAKAASARLIRGREPSSQAPHCQSGVQLECTYLESGTTVEMSGSTMLREV